MSENSTDRIYTEALRNNYQGHALYPDIATTDLKPGSLGYFDADGKWALLCQLADNESVKNRGCEPLTSNFKVEENSIILGWCPIHSKHVNGTNISLKGSGPT